MRIASCSALFGFFLIACGGSEPAEQPLAPAEQTTPAESPASERNAGEAALRLRLTGEGAALGEPLSEAALNGSAQLQVRELNPTVNLALTASFEQNTSNLVQLHLSFQGVENTMGPHHMEIGPPTDSAAYMQAYLELQSYSSSSGTLDVTLTEDGDISGTLQAELFKDSEPGELDEAGERISLSATFEGVWSLFCTSPVPALPGDHSMSNSAYCRGLTF